MPLALWGVVGSKQRRRHHVLFWCAGGVVFGLGVGLIGLRSTLPAPMTISLAFALVDCGLLLRWQSLRTILNRPRVSWFTLIGLALACFLALEWSRSTGVIAWPLVAYPIQLVLACLMMWDCARIAREQNSMAAGWMLASYLLPSASIAIQLVIFLTSREMPIAVYPAQTTPVTGVTMVFLAVISNFAFLGILLERRARQQAEEIKRAEREAVLREFSDRLSRQDRLRSLGALAGALAHELTQPLTAILSNAELAEASLQRGGQNAEEQAEQQTELVQGILRSAIRGTAIVQRIRQRLQLVEPVLGRVDLFWISADVIDLMAPLIEAHQVVLVRPMPDTPLLVSGDSIELSQVLVIVLTNAIEASEASASRPIEITLQVNAGRAQWSVRDYGHGFSSEALTSASEALFTTKPGGLGLGLEIATTIVRQHHGALTLANAPGGGAIVVIDLPLALPSNPSGD
ncbi:MAG: ATP-binding protein [Betaproteobacteria bacterium]